MADPNEICALQASYRGAIAAADALAALAPRIDALDRGAEVDPALLEDLRRVSAAHAIASAALRGFVLTMLRRRGGEPAGS